MRGPPAQHIRAGDAFLVGTGLVCKPTPVFQDRSKIASEMWELGESTMAREDRKRKKGEWDERIGAKGRVRNSQEGFHFGRTGIPITFLIQSSCYYPSLKLLRQSLRSTARTDEEKRLLKTEPETSRNKRTL